MTRHPAHLARRFALCRLFNPVDRDRGLPDFPHPRRSSIAQPGIPGERTDSRGGQQRPVLSPARNSGEKQSFHLREQY